MDSLTALSDRVEAMPLEELVASATRVAQHRRRLLASQGVAEVPPKLAAALEELRASSPSCARAARSTTSTPRSPPPTAPPTRSTAAADDLPALARQPQRGRRPADAALASVGPGSEINRDTLRLLQEVRDAARSVNALVQALERRPNSVLFGR